MRRDLTVLRFGALGMISVSAAPATADVFHMPAGQTSLELVPVGNAGNGDDYQPDATGVLHPYGGVPYAYQMGKFEVTIGQYAQFLNAVAAMDPYGLYNPKMATDANSAGIARSGGPGGYTYSPIGSPNRPIAYVSWADAARFANWLTNGQPPGPQGPATTETGSYALNGATTSLELESVVRGANARYVIPTENEWYKAAYYDPTPGAGGGENYWFYPMRTDGPVYSAKPPGTAAPNAAATANFHGDDGLANGYNDGFAVTGTTVYSRIENYLTDVGSYAAAASYYGTFDQGGNVMEWNEAVVPALPASTRGFRGGAWGIDSLTYPGMSLHASVRGIGLPSGESRFIGFRIALVPEPATLGMIALGAALIAGRRRR